MSLNESWSRSSIDLDTVMQIWGDALADGILVTRPYLNYMSSGNEPLRVYNTRDAIVFGMHTLLVLIGLVAIRGAVAYAVRLWKMAEWWEIGCEYGFPGEATGQISMHIHATLRALRSNETKRASPSQEPGSNVWPMDGGELQELRFVKPWQDSCEDGQTTMTIRRRWVAVKDIAAVLRKEQRADFKRRDHETKRPGPREIRLLEPPKAQDVAINIAASASFDAGNEQGPWRRKFFSQPDLVRHVATFLTARDVAQCMRVGRTWRADLARVDLWLQLLERDVQDPRLSDHAMAVAFEQGNGSLAYGGAARLASLETTIRHVETDVVRTSFLTLQGYVCVANILMHWPLVYGINILFSWLWLLHPTEMWQPGMVGAVLLRLLVCAITQVTLQPDAPRPLETLAIVTVWGYTVELTAIGLAGEAFPIEPHGAASAMWLFVLVPMILIATGRRRWMSFYAFSCAFAVAAYEVLLDYCQEPRFHPVMSWGIPLIRALPQIAHVLVRLMLSGSIVAFFTRDAPVHWSIRFFVLGGAVEFFQSLTIVPLSISFVISCGEIALVAVAMIPVAKLVDRIERNGPSGSNRIKSRAAFAKLYGPDRPQELLCLATVLVTVLTVFLIQHIPATFLRTVWYITWRVIVEFWRHYCPFLAVLETTGMIWIYATATTEVDITQPLRYYQAQPGGMPQIPRLRTVALSQRASQVRWQAVKNAVKRNGAFLLSFSGFVWLLTHTPFPNDWVHTLFDVAKLVWFAWGIRDVFRLV